MPWQTAAKGWVAGASLVASGALVVGLLFLVVGLRDGLTAAVAALVEMLPVGYAFAAGMAASVNPCGFFLLPSYVAFYLQTQGQASPAAPRWMRVGRALVVGGTATLGFVTAFGGVGSAVALGGRGVLLLFPYGGLVIGAALVGLGVWLLLSQKTLGVGWAGRAMITPRRTLGNVFLFGVAYAVASLSCTLPIFLVVVGSALATRGIWVAIAQFLTYALGMGTVLVLLTVSTALFREAVARWLRGAVPLVHRLSALFLIGAGGYLLYYWGVYARPLF
jgi:cytochrome c-type biogenesis protein